MKKYILTLLLSGCFFGAMAQQLYTARLDSLLNTVAVNNKNMGSLTLSQNGKVIYQKAIGQAAVISGKPMPSTVKTHYRIGSITKMFTAVMVFQLIQENKLGLSTTLAKFYPQLPNADKITIGMMLNHRSGLRNLTNEPAYATYMLKLQTHAQMLTTIAALKPEFEPDTKAAYSNTNFILLGYIIEHLTGKTYSEALKQRITDKIGLADTYYGGPINTAKNEAYSFTYTTGWTQQPETDMSIPGGAGAIVSTPTDLVKFIEALFDGKLVTKEHLENMKAIKDNYGMGMVRIPFYERMSYGHSGGIDGFTSLLGYFPDDKLAFAYTSNGAGGEFSTNDIIGGVLRIYFGKSYTIPNFKIPATKAITLKSADLDKFLGNYSSAQMPLKITVTKNDNILMAQATGQNAFALAAVTPTQFEFKTAGIVMEFSATGDGFTLKQGGGTFKFVKDK